MSWRVTGAERSGSGRDEREITEQCIIVTGRSDEEFETARGRARAQAGVHGSTPGGSAD